MVETIMNKNVTTEISMEEREKLTEEIIGLLEEYDYHPTKYGVNKMLDEWQRNNGWLIELMKKHPNYLEGKYMIAFDADYDRTINRESIISFLADFHSFLASLSKPYKICGFTYKEVSHLSYYLERLKNHFCTLVSNYGWLTNRFSRPIISINGKTEEEFNQEYEKFYSIKLKFDNLLYSNENFLFDNITGEIECYKREEVVPIIKTRDLIDEIIDNPNQFVSEKLAAMANKISDKIRAKEGQKTSRLVNKICKLFGFDKTENYNQNYAAFADAINPLKIKRHTIISCNPIDYFTMSFGNSWASCHTIDKDHKRIDGSDENYQGMYSGGTLSYMLDDSSVVFYTVNKNYDGIDYELQDKINRCMFHLGEDKIIQGRVYPQSNDGENSIYKIIREIAQKVFADCLGVANLWSNKKGTYACGEVTYSYGAHYKDYLNFESCNVSYLKREENGEEVNKSTINIGHGGICPCCGKEHNESNTIECYDCYNEYKTCHGCGCTFDESNLREIDGELYCEDCCFYCDYHQEWEPGSPYGHIDDYDFCEDALTEDDICYCDHCEEYYWAEDGIETVRGTLYCSERCAEEEGCAEVDGEWHNRNEIAFCNECNSYVLLEDYDSEHEMCKSCYEESQENNMEYEIA